MCLVHLPPAWLWCTLISIQTPAAFAKCSHSHLEGPRDPPPWPMWGWGPEVARRAGGHGHGHYLERLSRAWMKLSVPELSFSGLSISDIVAKTTSLARNLCLKPKWMLKVCMRMSFILQPEEAMWLSLCVYVGVSSSCGWALAARPGEQMCCCPPPTNVSVQPFWSEKGGGQKAWHTSPVTQGTEGLIHSWLGAE